MTTLLLGNLPQTEKEIDGSKVVEVWTGDDWRAYASTKDGRYWVLYEESDTNYSEWQEA